MSDPFRPCELQHARPPCPSPIPGVHPNPSNTISLHSLGKVFSCLILTISHSAAPLKQFPSPGATFVGSAGPSLYSGGLASQPCCRSARFHPDLSTGAQWPCILPGIREKTPGDVLRDKGMTVPRYTEVVRSFLN